MQHITAWRCRFNYSWPPIGATSANEMPESSFQTLFFVSLFTYVCLLTNTVRILRDTGGSQSIILADVLPFSELSYCGFSVILRAVDGLCSSLGTSHP